MTRQKGILPLQIGKTLVLEVTHQHFPSVPSQAAFQLIRRQQQNFPKIQWRVRGDSYYLSNIIVNPNTEENNEEKTEFSRKLWCQNISRLPEKIIID